MSHQHIQQGTTLLIGCYLLLLFACTPTNCFDSKYGQLYPVRSKWQINNETSLSETFVYSSKLSYLSLNNILFKLPTSTNQNETLFQFLTVQEKSTHSITNHPTSDFTLTALQFYFPKQSFQPRFYNSTLLISFISIDGILNVDPKSVKIKAFSQDGTNEIPVSDFSIDENGYSASIELNCLLEFNTENISIALVTSRDPVPTPIKLGEEFLLSFKSSYFIDFALARMDSRRIGLQFSKPNSPISIKLSSYRATDLNGDYLKNVDMERKNYVFLDAIKVECEWRCKLE